LLVHTLGTYCLYKQRLERKICFYLLHAACFGARPTIHCFSGTQIVFCASRLTVNGKCRPILHRRIIYMNVPLRHCIVCLAPAPNANGTGHMFRYVVLPLLYIALPTECRPCCRTRTLCGTYPALAMVPDTCRLMCRTCIRPRHWVPLLSKAAVHPAPERHLCVLAGSLRLTRKKASAPPVPHVPFL
jgi:hypothetical protein